MGEPLLNPFIKKRMEDELKIATQKNTADRTVTPLRDGDPSIWRGYLKGANAEFHSFELKVSDKFPLEPPSIEWLTPIKHPNIEPPRPEGLGRICLPWISDPKEWNPQTRINSIIDGLVYLLNNPNPYDPLMNSTCLRGTIDMLRDKGKISNDAKNILDMASSTLSRGDNKSAYDLVKRAGLLTKAC
jgi:ubiquitin-protein ligase